MIIANGYISICTQSGGGVDSLGRPTATTDTWSSLIPCQWEAESQNLGEKDAEGNAMKAAKYNCLIELRYIVNGEKIRLYDEDGTTLIAEGSASAIDYLKKVSIVQFRL